MQDWDSLSAQPPGIGGSSLPNADAVGKLVQAKVAARQSADDDWNSLSAAPPKPVSVDGSTISAAHEGLWDRFKDVASDTIHHSPAGALARWASGFLPSTEDYSGAPGADNSVVAQQGRAQQRVTQQERDYRDQYEGATADDPWRRPDGTTLGNAARFATDAAGMLVGGAVSDPTNAFAPGDTLLGKMVGQAALGGTVDAGLQGVEKLQGVRDHYDPLQTVLAAGGGAALVGAHHILTGGVHGAPDVSTDQLTAAPLDGAPPATPALPAPASPVALLPPPASGPPIALPDGVPRLPPPPPQLPDLRGDISAPANSNAPPPVGNLNSAVTPDVIAGQAPQVSPEAQNAIAQITARIKQAMDAQAPDTSLKWSDLMSSTAQPPKPANADLHRITMMSESRGNDAAVSPVGAKGRMQVMDGTDLNPGFGVRPAANGSLAERARVGTDYFDAMMQRYGGDPAKAWGAYNWGPGHMDAALAAHGDSWLAHAPAETRAYVDKNMAQLGGDAPQPSAIEMPVSRRAAPAETNAPAPAETPLDQLPSESERLADGPQVETPSAIEGSPAEAPSVEAKGPSKAPEAVSSSTPAPEDALTWLAKQGGLRDDEGHDLRGTMSLQRPIPGAGSLIRKDGMSIDEAGELLHEAGWFPHNGDVRPTAAETLDFLEQAGREKQYHLDDLPEVQRRQQLQAQQDHIDEHMQDLPQIAADYGTQLTPHETAEMRGLIAEGRTAHDAFATYHERAAEAHAADLSRETTDPVYDGPDFKDDPGYERATEEAYRADAARSEGQPGLGGDAGERGPVGGNPAEDTGPVGPAQSDAFGSRPGDERTALEQRADGRQRADVAQKPPGSDGGLFDTPDTQRDLFFRARDEGLGRTRPTSRPLAQDLRTMASIGPNTHARRLAAHLADLVGDAEVRYGEKLPEDVRGAAGIDEKGNVGATIAHENDPEALLHEAIHVSTLSRYGLLKEGATEGKAVDRHVQALEQLRTRAQKAFARRSADPTGKIEHALSNTDEFLAGGLTSREVQGFLQRHNTAGLWGRFVDGVRGILGLKPHYGQLLDRVLQHGAETLAKMPEDAPLRPAERVQLFSKAKDAGAPIDAERPGAAGWKRIGDLVFEKDFSGAGMTDAVKRVFGDPKAALKATATRMKQFGEVTAYSADSTLRSIAGRFDAPTIAKLADLFHAEAGKASGTGRTFQEAVTRNVGRFGNDLHDALKPHLENDAAMGRIRDLLATPDRAVRATTAEREAAGKVRDLLKEVLEYRRDAGEDIGEVGDGYFPRRVRADKVAADSEGFRAQATKLYSQLGVDDPAGAADAFMLRIMDNHAGISDGLALTGSGSTSSAKAREFGKAADSLLKGYYETNPLRALSDYVTGSVRRAEQTRRFGPVGRLGSAEREAWIGQHGADATQWGVMKDAIKAELRAKGGDATNIMERIDGIRQTNLGMMRPGSMRTGAVVSTIHAWNQLGTLANSTFASLPEMAMGFVRGGPRYGFTHLATTFSEFARNVRKLPASDARRYAEAIGSVGSDTAMDLLRARADDPSQSVALQKLLHSFYRKNGLEQWTDAGRTAAVKTGQRFVDALAHDLVSTDGRTKTRAAGYLRELGVKDPEAFGRAVRNGAPTIDELRGDKGLAGQYATALLRFADQSVLMPTRATKPSWASHPLGSLLFALQSYNYAFKKNVLDRVGRLAIQGVKERDPAKLAPAAGLVVLTGVTALVQGLRHIWDGQPAGADQESGWHYALETLDRAGMFGAASPLLNAFEGLRYRRSVGSVLQGAVIGRAAQAADAIGGLAVNTSDTNTAQRKAAGAVYDMAVKPAIDAVGAGVLRGPLGSAAILGSGKKPGAILPSDKEAFTTALAGPDDSDD